MDIPIATPNPLDMYLNLFKRILQLQLEEISRDQRIQLEDLKQKLMTLISLHNEITMDALKIAATFPDEIKRQEEKSFFI
jgi:hypothetical protein